MAALPAASDAAGKSVVLTDVNGEMSKIAESNIGIVKNAMNSTAVDNGWIRIANLGEVIDSYVFCGEIIVESSWGMVSPFIMIIDMAIISAVWDFNRGATNEGRFIRCVGSTLNSSFKLRLVAEIKGSKWNLFLELYVSDDEGRRKIRTYIRPHVGKPIPMTVCAGSVPSGAVSSEHEITV